MRKENGREVQGRSLRVEVSKPRDSAPRRYDDDRRGGYDDDRRDDRRGGYE